jgi:hypothetical protein
MSVIGFAPEPTRTGCFWRPLSRKGDATQRPVALSLRAAGATRTSGGGYTGGRVDAGGGSGENAGDAGAYPAGTGRRRSELLPPSSSHSAPRDMNASSPSRLNALTSTNGRPAVSATIPPLRCCLLRTRARPTDEHESADCGAARAAGACSASPRSPLQGQWRRSCPQAADHDRLWIQNATPGAIPRSRFAAFFARMKEQAWRLTPDPGTVKINWFSALMGGGHD